MHGIPKEHLFQFLVGWMTNPHIMEQDFNSLIEYMEYNIYVHACVIIFKHKIKELHAMKDRKIQGNNVAKY